MKANMHLTACDNDIYINIDCEVKEFIEVLKELMYADNGITLDDYIKERDLKNDLPF